ncbi:large ribosomal subunit protein bL33m [Callorhinus ursinus]|uniref:Large ribosomal subunit protein bL33m n=3 Tax=Pinnipedia TaxID=3072905 RepID=A0A3Q7NR06_CALUR|nr:39S ribosomal protein L33, mitochondrial [Callorhinus ursinus]XP_027479949.1 39S ribosomal protein L33, mitochondrial isoform X1 [Zalophus californianus]
MRGAWLQAATDVLFRNRPVPRKQLFAESLWSRLGDCVGVVTMFLSAVTFAKSKSKTILVKMLSQAGTGYSFNTKRSRLREKLTLLHYDPIVKAKVLFVEQKKIRSL